MYIRQTKTRSRKSGQDYFTYRLVESQRIADKVRQRTVLNLGKNFDVDRKHWPAVVVKFFRTYFQTIFFN